VSKVGVITAVALVTALVVGCGSSSRPSAATSFTRRPSASPPGAASSSISSPAPSRSYTSKNFLIPVTAVISIPLDVTPTSDTPTFLTWESTFFNDKIRFMLPVVIYRPGQSTPEQVPSDYLTYIHSLTAAGAVIADEKKTTVAGHPATLFTLTDPTSVNLDGIIGCPASTTAPADCYGPSSDLLLRVAVIDDNGKTLLAWARVDNGATETATFLAAFESTLAGLTLG